MFEKVNPSHPDKLADRIAGALVDLAYATEKDPKVAVEVLLGHDKCHIINETSVELDEIAVSAIVKRIAGCGIETEYREFKQDPILSGNQRGRLRCGDNGIFRGVPVTAEQQSLTNIAGRLYSKYPFDGKFILATRLIVCQSNVKDNDILTLYPDAIVNPLGEWTGGPNVDSGAVNRKLGSDMGDAVTGGGLHGKDLSKADVSVNIYCHLQAQRLARPVDMFCAIGDETVCGVPYEEIVAEAREYIRSIGGFERFAEWGLVRPRLQS